MSIDSRRRLGAITALVLGLFVGLTLLPLPLTGSVGISQDTAGSRPRRASRKNQRIDVTFRVWPSSRTVPNHGNGFQIPGVRASWWIAAQTISSSLQSGCVPVKT